MTRTQPEKPEEERSDRTDRNPAGTRKREAAEHSRRKQIDGKPSAVEPTDEKQPINPLLLVPGITGRWPDDTSQKEETLDGGASDADNIKPPEEMTAHLDKKPMPEKAHQKTKLNLYRLNENLQDGSRWIKPGPGTDFHQARPRRSGGIVQAILKEPRTENRRKHNGN